MTQQDAVKWLEGEVGKKLDFDGQYGCQCFDAFNYYYKYLTGRNPYTDGYGVPGAKDIWNVPTSRFTKIANNPKDPNQLPQPGDILVYGAPFGRAIVNGKVVYFGHVETCKAATTKGVTYIGENEHGNQYEGVTEGFRSWSNCIPGLIGWLRFNGYDKPTPMVTKAQLNQLYKDLLGRAPDQSGTNTYVAHQTYLQVENDIKNSPEYKKRQAALAKAKETTNAKPTPPVATKPSQPQAPTPPAPVEPPTVQPAPVPSTQPVKPAPSAPDPAPAPTKTQIAPRPTQDSQTPAQELLPQLWQLLVAIIKRLFSTK